MIEFNKKQMAILAKNEMWLKTAVYCDYIRATTTKQSEEVAQIWRDVKEPEMVFNPSCGSCVFQLFKKVGAAYFAQKELEQIKPKKKK